MGRAVFWSPQAREDLVGAAAWIAADNPDAARRFIAAARATADSLTEQPGRGTLRSFANPALAGVRMVAVRGFRRHLMFYRPDETTILVVRVLYGGRDVAAEMGNDG